MSKTLVNTSSYVPLLSYWTFCGKEKALPKNLKYTKTGSFDRRYKNVKKFLSDKRWVYKPSIYEKLFLETIQSKPIFTKYIQK